jgi:predicted ATPase
MGPVFDSSGVHLPFAELSDGEREIAFLVGQIERFKLRRGLLPIDEPELHLNPDLLRTWLQFCAQYDHRRSGLGRNSFD